MPSIHGDRIVFTSEGDLWIGSLKDGTARRLTSDEGIERHAQFSPDGAQIAFEAEYDGRQAYVMPAGGGIPRRLTWREGFRAVTGWTPDGKAVVCRGSKVPTNYEYFTVPAAGGVPEPLPLEFASHVWYGAEKSEYAFTRFNRWYSAWFRYVGGMQNQIWVAKNGKFRQATSLPGTCEYPVWASGRIYFVQENQGRFTLMSVSPDGGQARQELPPSDVEIRELDTDGARIVFEKGLGVEVFDPLAKSAKPVAMALASDGIHMRPAMVPASGFAESAGLSPTGKRLFVETRGQIASLAVGEGEARLWKSEPGARLRKPAPSPDGRHIAYVSDQTGEEQVWVSLADGSEARQVTKDGGRQIQTVRWSPDSKWIAFIDSRMTLRLIRPDGSEEKKVCTVPFTWFGFPFDFSPDSGLIVYSQVLPRTSLNAIEVFEVATGKTTRVSSGWSDDFAPSFSRDGKWIAFLSRRSLRASGDPILNQLNMAPPVVPCLLALKLDEEDPFLLKDPAEPAPAPATAPAGAAPAPPAEPAKPGFRIDFEGLEDRRIELPLPPGAYSQIAVLEGRALLASPAGIQSFTFADKRLAPLNAAPVFALSSDGAKLLVGGGSTWAVVDAKSGGVENAGFGSLRIPVDPPKEWRQIFWDAWRLLRDYFYVENMRGLDWHVIGRKYEDMLPSVRSRSELDEVIRWMQAELGSSHQYLSEGDNRDLKTRVPGAYLGIDLAADPSGRYRIAKILRGDGFRNAERSPLLGPGRSVKEGMFLLALGGRDIKVGEDPWEGLVGRAGQTISVRVASDPMGKDAKTYLVRPVPSEQRMRYLDWVKANRDYVAKQSGGRVGYIHISAMGTEDMEDFVRQYFPQRGRQSLLIDSRFNNGGWVQDIINRVLASRLDGFFNMRNSPESWTRQSDFFYGPMAVVMNEFNISCGEEFPHRFRSLKLGPLIGRRTMGGEVGSSPGWPLMDGGVISVPNYGMWTPEKGWVIEGPGVEPDIDVPSDPNAFVSGRDPQLDRAIEWLVSELRKYPPLPSSPPPGRIHPLPSRP